MARLRNGITPFSFIRPETAEQASAKMKTKLLTLLLSLCTSLKLCADVVVDGLNYRLDALTKTAAVTAHPEAAKGMKYAGDIVIPSEIAVDGAIYKITHIDGSAFDKCEGLTSIVIPNGVTSIEWNTFRDCTSLTSVTLPDSLKTIDGSRYYGYGAFTNCRSLTSIALPKSLKSIGPGAFSGCSSLTSVKLPESLISIGYGAFWSCSALTSLEIPNAVTDIDDVAFYGCNNLVSVTLPESLPRISGGMFSHCGNLTSVEIPDSVTRIEGNAFYECSSLTSIELPKSLKTIGPGAFWSCCSLTSMKLPESLTSIEDGAFAYCTSLRSIEIPQSVTRIENGTFHSCTSLSSIEIPQSVNRIGAGAFEGCSSLTAIELPNDLKKLEARTFRGCSSLTSVKWPDSLTVIEGEVGYYEGGAIRNAYGTFQDCTSLTSIKLPESLKTIGPAAFHNCARLTSITLPKSLTDIDLYAFMDCTSLTSIVFPDSLRNIGTSAFTSCHNLASVEFSDSVESIGHGAFSGCHALTSVVLPNSVKTLGNSVFSDCTHLVSAKLSDSMQNVSNYTFSGCSNLASVVLPKSLTGIGQYAFQNCSSLASVDIPESMTTIGISAFEDCTGLTSIEFPESVTSIGQSAFADCTNLTSIKFPASLTSIGDVSFADCSSLASLELPESLTEIGAAAFTRCRSLVSVSVPEKVEHIASRAFWDCNALKELLILSPNAEFKDYNGTGGYLYAYEPVFNDTQTNCTKMTLTNPYFAPFYVYRLPKQFAFRVRDISNGRPGAKARLAAVEYAGQALSPDADGQYRLTELKPGGAYDICLVIAVGDTEQRYTHTLHTAGDDIATEAPVAPGFYYITSAYSPSQGAYVEDGQLRHDAVDVAAPLSAAHSKFIWEISVAAGETYYLRNYATGAYAGSAASGTVPATGRPAEYLIRSSARLNGNAEGFALSPAENEPKGWNCHGGTTRNTVVFWTVSGYDSHNSYWKLTPVSEEDVLRLPGMVVQDSLNRKLSALVSEAIDSLCAAGLYVSEAAQDGLFPNALGKDAAEYRPDGILVSDSQISTNAPETDEGMPQGLTSQMLDGVNATFFHSTWSAGNPQNQDPVLDIDLLKEYHALTAKLEVRITHGSIHSSGRPRTIVYYGTNDAGRLLPKTDVPAEAGVADYTGWTELGTATIGAYPYANSEGVADAVALASLPFGEGNDFRYLRLRFTDNNAGSTNGWNYVCISELRLYDAGARPQTPVDKVSARILEELNAQIEAAQAQLAADGATQPQIDALRTALDAFIARMNHIVTAIGRHPSAGGPDTGKAVYDLSGRRVPHACRGIYIVGGRKVLAR